MNQGLARFENAHQRDFQTALSEIKTGRKTSHWMWYIFPQLKGLGFSETSRFYAIENLEEAQALLDHPILGKNLILIATELLAISTNSARAVFGTPDDMKLQSSMTLFSLAPKTNPVFQKVLDKYFNGDQDMRTVQLLNTLDS